MDLSNPLKRMFRALDGLKDIVDVKMAPDLRGPFYDPIAGLAMYTGIMASMVGYDLCDTDFKGEANPPDGLDMSEPLKRSYAYHGTVLGLVEGFPVAELKSLMLDHTSQYLLHLDEVAEAFDYEDNDEEELLVSGETGVIRDQAGGDGKIRITTNIMKHGVLIYAEGYGDKTSEPPHGSPVVLELYEGKLRLIVWADINQEDPTHTIDLSGAMESNRKEG